MFQWSPSCACCGSSCAQTCWTVYQACYQTTRQVASGATVTVYNASGTSLASGTTNSSGQVCLDLSAYSTTSGLYYTVSFSSVAGYANYTGALAVGSICGASITVTLAADSSHACCSACNNVPLKRALNMSVPYPDSTGMIGSTRCGIGCTFSSASVVAMNYSTSSGVPLWTDGGNIMQCSGSNVSLTYSFAYKCSNPVGAGAYQCGASPGGFYVAVNSGTVNASSVSFGPFSATFAVPSLTINCYTSSSGAMCGSILVPSQTITIYE